LCLCQGCFGEITCCRQPSSAERRSNKYESVEVCACARTGVWFPYVSAQKDQSLSGWKTTARGVSSPSEKRPTAPRGLPPPRRRWILRRTPPTRHQRRYPRNFPGHKIWVSCRVSRQQLHRAPVPRLEHFRPYHLRRCNGDVARYGQVGLWIGTLSMILRCYDYECTDPSEPNTWRFFHTLPCPEWQGKNHFVGRCC